MCILWSSSTFPKYIWGLHTGQKASQVNRYFNQIALLYRNICLLFSPPTSKFSGGIFILSRGRLQQWSQHLVHSKLQDILLRKRGGGGRKRRAKGGGQEEREGKDGRKLNTYGFQCSFEILYRLENMMGRMTLEFSSIKLMMYSLFQ